MTLVQTEPKSIKIWSTNIKRVMMRPNGTEKQIRPTWWQPWANTYLYLPMKEDFLDKTEHNTINNSWAVIQDISGVKCWYFNNNRLLCNQVPLSSKDITVSVWLKTSSSSNWWILWSNRSWIWNWDYLMTSTSRLIYEAIYWTLSTYDVTSSSHMVSNTRTHLCYSGWRLYINWQDVTSSSPTFSNFSQWYAYSIWQQLYSNWSVAWNAYIWYMSEYIIENKTRTAQEVSDYYNLTKWTYWL